MAEITEDIFYAGVDDKELDLFEGQYKVPAGMAYNSYVVKGERTAVTDTVDAKFVSEWLANIAGVLGGSAPDYLVVHHMEPDHSAGIAAFAAKYPQARIVGNAKTFVMTAQFFGDDFAARRVVVKENDELDLGGRKLKFIFAPMVHWPEVMMSFDDKSGALFSADAYGRFGASDAEDDWACEARRYYFGIVGKYGVQVQNVLKKAAALPVKLICPLHGPVLKDNLAYYIGLYDTWSAYRAEAPGVTIAYTSVYGHTARAVKLLADKLTKKGVKVALFDLARCDISEAVEDAFKYDRLVLATTTYNGGVFPFMREFIEHLAERNYRDRRVAFIENGSWSPLATKVMREMLEPCKGLTFAKTSVCVRSAVSDSNIKEIEALAEEFAK